MGGNPAVCGNNVCPTKKGGYCYHNLRACEIYDDGIEGTCLRGSGCGSHSECGNPNQYCMSCGRCESYRTALPVDQRGDW